MNNHISDIYIKSFKGISNLKLKDIKLINILTGGNNSGKTKCFRSHSEYEKFS